ncbi:hypothetical protein ACIBO9_27000 [Streptomyces prunicolor]|uniref:hypothetical protein n=1 Tax=Streptomyces prunicolor TaxID=67348 RepID=UPI0037D926EC
MPVTLASAEVPHGAGARGGAAVVVGVLGVVLAVGALAYARNSYGSSAISSQSMSPW